MHAVIRIEQGGASVGQVRLDHRPLVYGRAPDCDVQIADQRLSRHHCQTELVEGRVVLTDLGSSNGSFYKNQRVQIATLGPGEYFFIGRTRVIVDRIQESGTNDFGDANNLPTRIVIGFGPPAAQAPGPPPAPAPAPAQGAYAHGPTAPHQAYDPYAAPPAAPPAAPASAPAYAAAPAGAGPPGSPWPPPPPPPTGEYPPPYGAHVNAGVSAVAVAPAEPRAPAPGPPPPAPQRTPPAGSVLAPGAARAASPPVAAPPHLLETASAEPSPVEGYQIFERLGEGSMGTVYSAQRLETGEICVLKLIEFTGSAKDAIFFIREAQAGSRIKHPNVVETVDFGESNGFLYLAMEYIDGGSLLDRIKQRGPLTNRECLDQLRQVTDALSFAFKKKIVHRDIKPANILLMRDGTPKLADFGLAKVMQQAGTRGLTQMGEARGTPIYMPPEQLTGAVTADQRSDIYSLGATYYHALSGHHPFRAPTVPEILRLVVTSAPQPLRERNPAAHPAIVAVLDRMLKKDANERYQTPDELSDALAALDKQVT